MSARATASGIASLGRYGDSTLVHMNPDEVDALASIGNVTINPVTGLPEAFSLSDVLKGIGGLGAGALGGYLAGPWGAAAARGLFSGVANKDVKKGLLDGMTSFAAAKALGGAREGIASLGPTDLGKEGGLQISRTAPITLADKVTAGGSAALDALSDEKMISFLYPQMGNLAASIGEEEEGGQMGESYEDAVRRAYAAYRAKFGDDPYRAWRAPAYARARGMNEGGEVQPGDNDENRGTGNGDESGSGDEDQYGDGDQGANRRIPVINMEGFYQQNAIPTNFTPGFMPEFDYFQGNINAPWRDRTSDLSGYPGVGMNPLSSGHMDDVVSSGVGGLSDYIAGNYGGGSGIGSLPSNTANPWQWGENAAYTPPPQPNTQGDGFTFDGHDFGDGITPTFDPDTGVTTNNGNPFPFDYEAPVLFDPADYGLEDFSAGPVPQLPAGTPNLDPQGRPIVSRDADPLLGRDMDEIHKQQSLGEYYYGDVYDHFSGLDPVGSFALADLASEAGVSPDVLWGMAGLDQSYLTQPGGTREFSPIDRSNMTDIDQDTAWFMYQSALGNNLTPNLRSEYLDPLLQGVDRSKLASSLFSKLDPMRQYRLMRDPFSGSSLGGDAVSWLQNAGLTPPGYAYGGMIAGGGRGMADDVVGMIQGSEPVGLSSGEFVIPADVVSMLGDGNSEAGAQELHALMARVRQMKTGNPDQAPPMDPASVMPA